MTSVKCIITYPNQFISEVGLCVLDGIQVSYHQEEAGKISFQRDNVVTSDGLNVFATLHGGNSGLECLMDIFVATIKINTDPVKATFLKGGHYVFNYNA